MNKLRRGATLLIALFMLSITCMFMADQARVLLLRMKLQKLQLRESQQLMLKHAAQDRARLQFEMNSEYAGETWQPELKQSNNDFLWEIVIRKAESDTETTPVWEIDVHLREKEDE